MAILKGEAARAWLAQNPSKAYKNITANTSVPRQQSGLEKFALGITKPFRQGAGIAQEFGYTLQDLLSMAKGGDQIERPDKYAFLSPEESQQLYDDPLKTGLKSGAGIAAYGVGGGGIGGAVKGGSALSRIGSAAKLGSIGGGLAGFGASDTGNELQGILSGGAIGGVAGGALQGVGEGVRALKNAKVSPKISEAGLETRGKAIGLDANRMASKRSTNVSSSTDGKKVIKSYFETMDELGLPTNTSELASKSSDDALALLKGGSAERGVVGFDDILSSADNNITFTSKDTDKLIKQIQSNFANNPKVQNNATYQELIGDLRGLGNSYKPSQLNSVRESARELVNWSSSANAPIGQRASKAVFNTLDDFFKNSVDGSASVLSKMKDIYTVRPFFQLKAPTAGSIKVGTASTNIAVPSGAIQERIPEAIGKAMQGAKMPSIGGGDLIQQLSQIGQRAIPAGVSQMGQGQPQQGYLPQEQGSMYQQPQIDPIAVIQAMLNGEITSTEAKFIMDTLGGSEGKLSKDQANAKSALQSLDTLEGVLSSDNSALAKSYLPFQGFDQNAQVLENAASNIEDVIARMRTGAVINDEEAARYRKMIPRIIDTAQSKVQKLQQLRSIFENIYSQNSSSTNTDALGSILGY